MVAAEGTGPRDLFVNLIGLAVFAALLFYDSAAGLAVSLTIEIEVNGTVATSYTAYTWQTFNATSHIPINMKARIAAIAGSNTANLNIYWSFGSWYNPTYVKYSVGSCILAAFASRR